ncbi:carbohydrate ABC transporter permease [Natrarchaeobaculum sulfurireducens]|uniref:ABC-type sugar transport system, permease component n=1 Tax=Natrarchaeobaculum sulfurireducens TaxID=2044521 RepID=A0A346PLI1_9EURY|nr:carbohydrate ABC transporter permease [Natrarchaeobaculum sulfurireducens]AXR76705.1 ABC-type sugar transport system, permease component [Natrarchaeobaculum sulfurireducens]AXR80376.1 Glycerol-3-phosphate ABC transporter, permease protein UgpE [Natrarchaeobaculum sulfurireducens]
MSTDTPSTIERVTESLERPTTDRTQLLVHIGLGVSVFLMAFPILIALLVSTQEQGVINSVGDLAPGSHMVDNYQTVMTDYNFGVYLLNSFIMSIIIVVGKLAISLLAALAIVYYRFPFKNLMFMLILFTLMLPVPVRFVPLFNIVTDLGWYNSMLALTIPYLASATTVFLLRQHFLSIPESIVEQAKLDGIGPLKFLVYVLIPMSKGMLAGVSVIMFIYAWNQYLWPLVIIDSQAQQVTQVGITLLQGDIQAGELQWSIVMAGAIITLIPPLLALIAFRKPLLETFGVQQK